MSALLPEPATLGVFAVAVLLLNATPGVDLLLTVTRTLQRGGRAGADAAVGIALGCVGHALAAAFGLAALLALHPGALALVQAAGAAYLAWLGVGLLRAALRGAHAAPAPSAAAAPASWRDDLLRGLLTNLLNPKVALFFLAFLPQFIAAGTPHPTAAFLALGAWFVVQSLLFLLVVVAVCRRLRRLRPAPGWRRGLDGAAGTLFLALAARLALDVPTS